MNEKAKSMEDLKNALGDPQKVQYTLQLKNDNSMGDDLKVFIRELVGEISLAEKMGKSERVSDLSAMVLSLFSILRNHE